MRDKLLGQHSVHHFRRDCVLFMNWSERWGRYRSPLNGITPWWSTMAIKVIKLSLPVWVCAGNVRVLETWGLQLHLNLLHYALDILWDNSWRASSWYFGKSQTEVHYQRPWQYFRLPLVTPSESTEILNVNRRAAMKSTSFWDLTPYSLVEVYRYFGVKYCLYFQGWRVSQVSSQQEASSHLLLPSTLKIEEHLSSETLANFLSAAWRHIL
jgi:hypothetical protein